MRGEALGGIGGNKEHPAAVLAQRRVDAVGYSDDVFGDGKELKRRYGFREYPSLVFLRDGKYVGTISRIQDWVVYLEQIAELLEAPTRRPPGFAIPVVTETTDEQREPLR